MTHCSDEELLLEYYGEVSRHSEHRRACAECGARYIQLRATLDSVALEPPEVKKILRQMRVEAPKVKVGFIVGQSVRIVDGPFMDFVGQVDDINLEKGKVKVLVSFFGRETPVELDFLQVERL